MIQLFLISYLHKFYTLFLNHFFLSSPHYAKLFSRKLSSVIPIFDINSNAYELNASFIIYIERKEGNDLGKANKIK